MGYRSFTDSTGLVWDAWEIVPQLGERRVAERRQRRQRIAFGDRRHPGERRIVTTRRAALTGALASGWLCFEGPTEKRRLSPIPEDWTRCPAAQLEEYCRMARPVRRSREMERDAQ
jgi:hypothetical protein